MSNTKKTYMVLYRIKENGPWEDVGAAFLNKDASWNVVIEKPIAIGDRLQLRTRKAKEPSAS
jgi:hypothetical protein